jgi:hypothetical protein
MLVRLWRKGTVGMLISTVITENTKDLSQKLKLEPQNPAIPWKWDYPKDNSKPMFIAAQFTVAKIGNHTKCSNPQMVDFLKCGIHTKRNITHS